MVMEYGYVDGGKVGLGKPPSHDFHLNYLNRSYAISKYSTTCIDCVKNKCAQWWRESNKFHHLFIFVWSIFMDAANLKNLLPPIYGMCICDIHAH